MKNTQKSKISTISSTGIVQKTDRLEMKEKITLQENEDIN